MNDWLKSTFNKGFLCILILLITINKIGFITEDALIIKLALPLCIPVFLIYFFIKHHILGIAFVSFLIFSFLGDMASFFFSGEVLIKASSILYIISYVYLLIMVAPKFKPFDVNALIGTYLLVVLSIALFFLYIIYNVLQTFIPDDPIEVLLFGAKSLTLVILGFISFAVYLNKQSGQSALFLTAVMFFGLSVMLSYINLYYLYHWNFELLQRILYVLALFVMFRYIIDLNLTKKTKQIHYKESIYRTDTVLS